MNLPGSLQFFGEWFGRGGQQSLDSCRRNPSLIDGHRWLVWIGSGGSHRDWPIRAARNGVVAIPVLKELELESDQLFEIRSASRVRWEWFHYGESKTPVEPGIGLGIRFPLHSTPTTFNGLLVRCPPVAHLFFHHDFWMYWYGDAAKSV